MHPVNSLESLPKEIYFQIVSELNQDSLSTAAVQLEKTKSSKGYIKNTNENCVDLARCSKTCYEKFEQFPKVWELKGLISHRFSIGSSLGNKNIQNWTTIAGMVTGGLAGFVPGVYLASLSKAEERQNPNVELSFPQRAKKEKREGTALFLFPLVGMVLGGTLGSKIGSFEITKKISGLAVGTYFSVVAIKSWGNDIALPKISKKLFG